MNKRVSRIILLLVFAIIGYVGYNLISAGTNDTYVMLIPLIIFLVGLILLFIYPEERSSKKQNLWAIAISFAIYIILLFASYEAIDLLTTGDYGHMVNFFGMEINDSTFKELLTYIPVSMFYLIQSMFSLIIFPVAHKKKLKKKEKKSDLIEKD